MFADVRGYTPLTSASAPEELADRITTLYRWASTEVGRRYGIVDKFAGDAVMATFNAAGARVDHAVLALEAALRCVTRPRSWTCRSASESRSARPS